MKKFFQVFFCAVLFSTNLFADQGNQLLRNLNSLSGGKTTAATGTIPEGKDLLPAVWYVTKKSAPQGVVDCRYDFVEIDAYNEIYSFIYQYSYKFGFLTQTAVCHLKVERDGSSFYVTTEKMYLAGPENRPKSSKEMNDLASQFANVLTFCLENFTPENFEVCWSEAYADLWVLNSVNQSNANKIKLKKWFKDHSIEGKSLNSKVYITKIDESDIDGYAYKISARGGYDRLYETKFAEKAKHKELSKIDLMLSGIPVTFYTNEDKFIDYKEIDAIENLTGKIQSVSINEDTGKIWGMTIIDQK